MMPPWRAGVLRQGGMGVFLSFFSLLYHEVNGLFVCEWIGLVLEAGSLL